MGSAELDALLTDFGTCGLYPLGYWFVMNFVSIYHNFQFMGNSLVAYKPEFWCGNDLGVDVTNFTMKVGTTIGAVQQPLNTINQSYLSPLPVEIIKCLCCCLLLVPLICPVVSFLPSSHSHQSLPYPMLSHRKFASLDVRRTIGLLIPQNPRLLPLQWNGASHAIG